MQESVELPEPATLFGAAEQDVLLLFRLTAPEKPSSHLLILANDVNASNTSYWASRASAPSSEKHLSQGWPVD